MGRIGLWCGSRIRGVQWVVFEDGEGGHQDPETLSERERDWVHSIEMEV